MRLHDGWTLHTPLFRQVIVDGVPIYPERQGTPTVTAVPVAAMFDMCATPVMGGHVYAGTGKA